MTPEQRSRWSELREQKEAGRFLLSEAPERKQRKNRRLLGSRVPLYWGHRQTLLPRKGGTGRWKRGHRHAQNGTSTSIGRGARAARPHPKVPGRNLEVCKSFDECLYSSTRQQLSSTTMDN